jgi:hypothetical protein
MTIEGQVLQAQAGIIGFDTTDRLNRVTAKQYYNKGYRFCLRYIGRGDGKSKFDDLIESEAQAIVNSGMALMAVQHPLAEGWVPTESMGQSFGSGAAEYAGDAGLPLGVTIWLDLEGVKAGTTDTAVVDYCNAWFAEVAAVGYSTGVYIGASPGITSDQMYWNLKTKAYWKGGSSAKSGVPDDIPHRGYQLVQYIQNPGKLNEFDSNVTKIDAFGNSVMWVIESGLTS